MTSEFHPLADRELADAASFYEDQSTGLGAAFLDEVDRLLSVLEAHPGVGRPTRELRSIPLHRFPYSLIYQLLPDGLFILAVAHHRRRPRYWTGRADSTPGTQ